MDADALRLDVVAVRQVSPVSMVKLAAVKPAGRCSGWASAALALAKTTQPQEAIVIKQMGRHLAGMEQWERIILGAFRSVVFEDLRFGKEPAVARLVAGAVSAIPDVVRIVDPDHAHAFGDDLTPIQRRRWEAAPLDMVQLTLQYAERLTAEELLMLHRDRWQPLP